MENGDKQKKVTWKEVIPMSIIDDGKQLSIRIPKKVVESLEINPEEDEFVFLWDKENLSLTGELVTKGSKITI